MSNNENGSGSNDNNGGNTGHSVEPAKSSGSSPPVDAIEERDELLAALMANDLAARNRFRRSGLIPGRAYVLTRDIYQAKHYRDGVSWGPMIRVFREGERFVCNSSAAEHDLHFALTAVDTPSVRDGLNEDETRDLLVTCIENDEPLPGPRDGTWAELAKHVREIPHTEETLNVLREADAYWDNFWNDDDDLEA